MKRGFALDTAVFSDEFGTGLRAELAELLRTTGSDLAALCAGLGRLAALHGDVVYCALLHRLSHLSFTPLEAKTIWRGIASHHEDMERALGSDVDYRVALLSYFVQVRRELIHPKIIESDLYDRNEASIYEDELTGLLNYRYLAQQLPRELNRSRRLQTPLSLVMIDIDDFKGYNDRHGHDAGNTALVGVAEVLSRTVSEYETPIRYGGEEFAVVLPSIPKSTAMEIAAGLCASVQRHRFSHLGAPAEPVTISLGVATCPADARDAAELIRRADEALYASKREGRNRVRPYGDSTRSYRRRPVQFPCQFRTFGRDYRSATGAVISEGGMMLVTSEPIPEGTILDVSGVSPESEHSGTIGRVVASDPRDDGRFEIGLAFVDRQAGAEEWVQRLLASG